MLSDYVELTIGHSRGVANNYDRFTEEQILPEYLKAVPALTINDGSRILNQRLQELQESAKEDSNAVKSRLTEKDNEIAILNRKVNQLTTDMNWFSDALITAKKIVTKSPNGMIRND